MLVLATNVVFYATFFAYSLFALIFTGVSYFLCDTLLILHAKKIKENKGKQMKHRKI